MGCKDSILNLDPRKNILGTMLIGRIARQVEEKLGFPQVQIIAAAEEAKYMGFKTIILYSCSRKVSIGILLRALNLYEDDYEVRGIIIEHKGGKQPKPLMELEIDRMLMINKKPGFLKIVLEAHSISEAQEIMRQLAQKGLEDADKICSYKVVEDDLYGEL